MTGSGGLHVAGTSTASTTTSGALRVGSNVGLSGNSGGASYFGGTIWQSQAAAGSTANLSLGEVGIRDWGFYATGGKMSIRPSSAGTWSFNGNTQVELLNTTSASSSTVGALTIGNGTAATNVAIGGGNVNAGGMLTAGGTGTHVFGATNQIAQNVLIGASNVSNGQALYAGISQQSNYGHGILGYNITGTPGSDSYTSPKTGTGGSAIELQGSSGIMRFLYHTGATTGGNTVAVTEAAKFSSGNLTINATTPSTLTTNGALVVTGGVGVGGALNVGGAVTAGGNVILNQGTYVLLNGAADLNSSLVRLAGNTILSAGGDVILKSSGATVLTGTSTGAATFAGAVTTGGTLTLPKAPAAGNRYILTGADATGTGQLVVQAGGGSASWGGTLNLFETAHATKGGWVGVGLGVTGAKFTINSVGFSDSGEVASIDRTGAATFAGIIKPQQATTAGAPAYVKGAIYFDTTLNKLRVGGATAWETITSV
jgi:hypothetical protein